MIGDDAKPKVKIGDMASHRGDIRIVDDLTKFRSPTEQRIIDKLFVKLHRGDREGLERSLRNKSVAGLKRRGVLDVERDKPIKPPFDQVARQLRSLNINTMPVTTAMAIQDDLPQPWRTLIYQHGQLKVFDLIRKGYTLNEAIAVLR